MFENKERTDTCGTWRIWSDKTSDRGFQNTGTKVVSKGLEMMLQY
jgi:hypothetical protein